MMCPNLWSPVSEPSQVAPVPEPAQTEDNIMDSTEPNTPINNKKFNDGSHF